MEKTKYDVEKLPYKLGDKIELIVRRQYENHKASDLSIRHKIDVKKTAVKDMIDMIVAGKVLDEGNEPQWQLVYDEIKADIELAQAKNAEILAEQNQKAEEEKKAKEEAAARDSQLANLATTIDIGATFASLADNFDLGNMDRCIPKADVSDETLVSALVAGMKMEDFSNWAKGDLVNELEKRGRVGAMQAICEATGIPYKSIYRMAVTARNVPPEKRDPKVSFTVYAEVANARFSKDDKEHQQKLESTLALVAPKTGDEKADTGKIVNSQDARKAVQAAQGKTPPTPPDPNAVNMEKDWFIVVNYEERESRAVIGYPVSQQELIGDGVDIIHAKTSRRAFVKGKGLTWTALDAHEEPKPATPEPAQASASTKKGAAAASKETKAAGPAPKTATAKKTAAAKK